MTFTEEWFGFASQTALAELAESTVGVAGDVVEVGSWEGRSTVALANAVAPDVVYAVDTWAGSPGEISAELAAERDVFAAFTSNVELLTAGNVVPQRMGWRDFFAGRDVPVRLCFIDAEHSYREVYDNIAAVLPLLSPGGVICGDDVHHEPVRRAVMDLLPDARCVATLWHWTKPNPAASLAEQYDRVCSTPSDIYLHLPRFVELVELLDAQHVIELGTRSGVSTIAWLYALEGRGRLTSVDIDQRPDIGVWPHWTFIQSDDLAPDLVAALEPADIVFVDTSHLFDQTLAELNVYRWLVKPGGRIVLHDTELMHPEGAPPRPLFPVRAAVEAFCDAEGLAWSNNPACWGLAEIVIEGVADG